MNRFDFRYLLCLLFLGLMVSLVDAAPADGVSRETIRVAGLSSEVEILVDRWGVPHIYANSQDDLFFAQGFNAARDRLFQIDLWRRRGLGQLSEVFGPAYIEQDRAARLFLYRGNMYHEWLAYASDAKRIATAFVAGVNAFVDFLNQHPDRLPFEFRQLGYEPARWQPEDVVRIRSHGLTRNLLSEVARALVACHSSLKADEIRQRLQPAWETQIPEGLDPCLPKNVLDIFKLATDEVHIVRPSGQAAQAGPGGRFPATAHPDDAPEGSNNWVIAPGKSSTGRPILANDPHRAYKVPSLRYIAHLAAPDIDVIGAGEPALPGISIGHNGSIAFGLTIFPVDQEDLYVYELNPSNLNEYRYRDRWEPFTVVREPIPVKGGSPVTIEMKFTRHGPVLHVESDKKRAYAVRSAWMEPGMSPYFGSIAYMRARTWDQFLAAMNRWGAPTENQVYADDAGNIGWVPGGLAPIRTNWDGLLPVPGDGRYEWAGFWDRDQLPSVLNPREGWFTTSNQMNLPDGYPYRERKLGFEWSNESRHLRIREVLASKPRISIEDSMLLQNDVLSIPARRLGALLAPLSSSNQKTRAALNLLKGWDYVELATSPQAALTEVWLSRHLGKAFKEAVLPKEAVDFVEVPDLAILLSALENPDARLGKDPVTRRNDLLLTTLTSAYREMEALQGDDPRQWQWGRLQQTLLEHPMAGAVDDTLLKKLNVGPFPRGGNAYTPNQSLYRTSDFRHTNGPSFRIIVDVGRWDNSWAINMPGQSGDPDQRHYRDLADMWRNGEYFPLRYSRASIEEVTEQVIQMVPAK